MRAPSGAARGPPALSSSINRYQRVAWCGSQCPNLSADPPGYHLLTVVAGISSSGVSQQHNYQQSSSQATNPTPVSGLGIEAYYASNDTTQQVVLWDVNLILVVKYTQVVGTPPADLQSRLVKVAQGVRAKLLAGA